MHDYHLSNGLIPGIVHLCTDTTFKTEAGLFFVYEMLRLHRGQLFFVTNIIRVCPRLNGVRGGVHSVTVTSGLWRWEEVLGSGPTREDSVTAPSTPGSVAGRSNLSTPGGAASTLKEIWVMVMWAPYLRDPCFLILCRSY